MVPPWLSVADIEGELNQGGKATSGALVPYCSIDNAAPQQVNKAPRQQVLVPACTQARFCQNKPTPTKDKDSCRTQGQGSKIRGDELKDAKQRLARANDRIPLLDYWGPVPGLAHPAAGPSSQWQRRGA